jgi:hypothetical protein
MSTSHPRLTSLRLDLEEQPTRPLPLAWNQLNEIPASRKLLKLSGQVRGQKRPLVTEHHGMKKRCMIISMLPDMDGLVKI